MSALREMALEEEVRSLRAQLNDSTERAQREVERLQAELADTEQRASAPPPPPPPLAPPSSQTEWVTVVDTLLHLSSNSLEELAAQLGQATHREREIEVRALEAEADAARLRVELQERDATAAAAMFATSVAEQRCSRVEGETAVAMGLLKATLQELDTSLARTCTEARAEILQLRSQLAAQERATEEASSACEQLKAAAEVGRRRYQRAEEDAAELRVECTLLAHELRDGDLLIGTLVAESRELQAGAAAAAITATATTTVITTTTLIVLSIATLIMINIPSSS